MKDRLAIMIAVLYVSLLEKFPWQWLGTLRKKGTMTNKNNPKLKRRSRKTRVVDCYKAQDGTVFQLGDTVKLNRQAFWTVDPSPPLFLGKRITKGKIEALLPDCPGLVLITPRLGGYWTWDVNELKKIN